MDVLSRKLKEFFGKSRLKLLIPVLTTIFLLFSSVGQSNEISELKDKLETSKVEYASLEKEMISLQNEFDVFKEENQEFIKEGKSIIEKRQKIGKDALEAVKKLELKPSKENLESAKKAIDLLDIDTDKKELAARIGSIEKIMIEDEKKEAEKKLLTEIDEVMKKMESNQTRENSQIAAEKLTKLSNHEKKEQYQKRIDAVNHAINVKEAEQQKAQEEAQKVAEQQQIQQFAQAPAGNVYYENCTAVRAAGAAPIRIGEPGYSRKLDRDGDGIGCE